MTTTPDPQTVREIARDCVADYIDDARDIAAHVMGHFGMGVPGNVYAWTDAVRSDLRAVVPLWPDDLPQDKRDGDEAAGRVTAYLNDHRTRYPYDAKGVIADLAAAYDNGLLPPHELLEDDLRAILDNREQWRNLALSRGEKRDGDVRVVDPLRDVDARVADNVIGLLKSQQRPGEPVEIYNAICLLIGQFGGRIEAMDTALEARDAKATPTTGWILWDAEGRWRHVTTSTSDDGWRAVSINDAEAEEWQQRNCILDRMNEAGWRAYNEGDKGRWQFDPGSRDAWLAARDAKEAT